MLQTATVKQRLLLYQGMLLALPLLFERTSALAFMKFETTFGVFARITLVSFMWYVGCGPFIYLALNHQLRQDVLKIFPKMVQKWFGGAQVNQIQNQIQNHAINMVQIQPINQFAVNNSVEK